VNKIQDELLSPIILENADKISTNNIKGISLYVCKTRVKPDYLNENTDIITRFEK